jgi:uncharacterized membrane protein
MNTLLTHLADRGGRFGRHGGAPWLSLVVVLLVAAAVAALVMWLLRRRGGQLPTASSTSAAQAIVAERLARGEIGPDEYHSLLATLRGETPVAAGASADKSAEPSTGS